jgi:glucosamine--fructose-6-phosphate aminotransferase (isomerizing)
MEALKPSVMVTQVLDLPRMMLEDTPTFDQQVRRLCTLHEYSSIKRVFITGNGDSYHASMAAEMAFENIANIPCEPMSAQRFLDYGAEWMPVLAPQDTLVIGISASGKTKRVVQSLERAKQYGALTIALTGTPDSPVTRVSDRTLCVQVSDLGRSPGIRTYSASLLGLFLIAIQLGEAQGRLSQDEADLLRKELVNLAAVVDATIRACDKPAQKAAQMCSDAGTMIFLGSGPSCGTAIFSAAKVVEAASVFSVGQDLEEWWHVEKFALPANIPTFLITSRRIFLPLIWPRSWAGCCFRAITLLFAVSYDPVRQVFIGSKK